MKKTFLSLFLVLTLLISITACRETDNENTDPDQLNYDGNQDNNSSKSNVIKISTVTPLSGPQASIGEAIKNGAQMALEEHVEEFNTLGFELKLSPQDDQADPKIGVSIARKLINDKDILANVAHFNSGVAIPSSVVYDTKDLLMVSPANTAVEITTRGLNCVNRIVANDQVQGAVAARFTFEDLQAKKVFIIHDKTTYGQGVAEEFKKAFEELSGEVVSFEGITQGETDFNGILSSVMQKNPDAVFFGGIFPEGSQIIKQMKDKNINAKFVGPDGMDSGEVIKIAGEAAIGTYYTSTAGDSSSTPKGKEWADNYTAKFDTPPENYAAYGYDAMKVAISAILKAIDNNSGEKPTRTMVTDSVKEIGLYEGIATDVLFDTKGDNVEGSVFIYEFKKAEYPADLVKSISAKEVLGK